MAQSKPRAFGTWDSPITAFHLSSNNIELKEIHVEPATETIYVVEGRPLENGRCTIISWNKRTGKWEDTIPVQYNIRSSVHEYGGAACTIGQSSGTLIFTDCNSNGVFAKSLASIDNAVEEKVVCIVEGSKDIRYADFDFHPTMDRYILAVRETHHLGNIGVTNEIVLIDSVTKQVQAIVSGADFYAHPRWITDASKISWMQWMHPNMPWTKSEVLVASCSWFRPQISQNKKLTISELELNQIQRIAGHSGQESICQPRWGEGDRLYFISDLSGWWQIYSVCVESMGEKPQQLELQGLEEAEFGVREFVLGSSTFALLNRDRMVAVATQNAVSSIILIDLVSKEWKDLHLDIVEVQNNGIRRISHSEFVVIGATTTAPMGVYIVSLKFSTSISQTIATKRLIKSSFSSELPMDKFNLSIPEIVSFPRVEPTKVGGNSHAIFFSPRNAYYFDPSAESKPPLILLLHGGPSAHVSPAFSLNTQYWTNRGYAFAAVNYVGSTGYGRTYRESLNGNWGIVDTVDAISCVQFLSAAGKIDKNRVGLIGASAGGYSVLQAIIRYPEVWAGAISLYGIGDLAQLARTMHKFEKFYLQQLLFNSQVEQSSIYEYRSPLFHADQIKTPLLLMHGADDKVVPLNQANEMIKTLANGNNEIPVELMIMNGEGHGWTKQVNIEKSIEKETEWWEKTLLR